jgi:hypothetical protein
MDYDLLIEAPIVMAYNGKTPQTLEETESVASGTRLKNNTELDWQVLLGKR